ncbi:50S ribosomal protein L23 [bacterium]|nr:50S ribosomal protein L23 [bacterium]
MRKLLRRPLQTEKSVLQMEEQNTYVFEVAPHANKIEVKRAIEEIFDVEVIAVRTMKMKGKWKRLGRFVGRRPTWKKALVTLKKGDTLELYENV